MSLLDAAIDLLRDTAHRRGTSINEDIVRRELGAIDFSRSELVEYLTSDNVYKLLTCLRLGTNRLKTTDLAV